MYYTNETTNKKQMEEAFYQNHQYPSAAGYSNYQPSRDVGGINISVNPVILVDCGEHKSNSSADTRTTTNNNPSVADFGSIVSGLTGALLDIFR